MTDKPVTGSRDNFIDLRCKAGLPLTLAREGWVNEGSPEESADAPAETDLERDRVKAADHTARIVLTLGVVRYLLSVDDANSTNHDVLDQLKKLTTFNTPFAGVATNRTMLNAFASRRTAKGLLFFEWKL